MLLYPDPRVSEQPDNLTTCFAAPIHACDFEHLWGIANSREDFADERVMPYVMLDADIYFLRSNGEVGYTSLVIILRTNEDPDTCLESAAWLRLKYEYNGMIYICHRSESAHYDWQTFRGIAAAGVDESLIAMVDLVNEATLEA